MRIAILTSDSYYSYLLISHTVATRPSDVVLIVITPTRVKGRSTLGTVRYVLKKSGARSLLSKVVASLTVSFGEVLRKVGLMRHCVVPSLLARKYNIPLLHSKDVNDETTLSALRQAEIDVILSVNVYQRMEEELLALPRITAINNHFGLLPKYKGMAPYVWAMANGEECIGLSVHHMVLKFDAGRLIRQERLPLRKGDSAMDVYMRGCMIARQLIAEAVAAVEEDPNAGFAQQGDGSYFSMPTRECIRNLYRNGFRLWRVSDLVSVLRSARDGEPLP